jgi:phage gp36-like protein
VPPITQYADEADLENYGLGDRTLEDIDAPEAVQAALEAASRVADGYLTNRYGSPFTLPLTAISLDLTMYVSWIAAYILMGSIGYSPEAGQDNQFERKYKDAIAWLKGVQAGDISPPDIEGSPPEESGPAASSGPVVVSGSSRGWSSRGGGGGNGPVAVYDLPFRRDGGGGGFVGD